MYSQVSTHVAMDTKATATSLIMTLEWFLSCVRVNMNTKRRRSGEGFSAMMTMVSVIDGRAIFSCCSC